MASSDIVAVTETTTLLGKPDPSDTAAVENGAVREVDAENPLFEGNAKAAQKLYLLVPAVGFGILLSAADQTLVVSSYGKIGSDLNALNNTSWIATGYLLTLTSFQPLYGKLSDIFGRKPALLFAYAVFGLGCLFCGLARTLPELVAARAFAGIGGGGMTTVVSILFSDIIPLRERGTWQGYINLIYAAGASGGAPLGGILADSIGWRWSFLGQAPLCLVAFGLVYFILELPKMDQSHWREKLAKVDFLGAFSLVIAVSFLLVGLDQGSNHGWSDTLAIVCCSVAAPLFAVFIFIEMKIASFPFAPGHIIFDRSIIASYLVNFFIMAAHMSAIFYVPLYLQIVDNLSASAAGTRLIPALIASVTGSLVGGRLMQRTGKYYWLTIICLFILLVGGTGLILSAGVLDSSWGLIIALSIASFGAGTTIVTTLIAVIANADPKDQAIATACTYLFRSLGCVIGVSLGSTVMQQVLREQLRSKMDSGDKADKIVERVRQSLDFIKQLDPQTRQIVTRCYENATTAAFGLTFSFGVLAFISSFWTREVKLSK